MKRKLALFMVLAMLISLVPMNVFAQSTNTVSNVPSVKVDQQATVTLNFEEKVKTDFVTGAQFRLDITNADIVNIAGIVSTTASNSAIVTIPGTVDNATLDVLALTLKFEVTEEANVTVDVSSLGTGISSQEGIVIAKGAAGATKSKVAGTVTIADGNTELKTISIEELSKLSLTTGDVAKIKLPANFEWVTAPTATEYGAVTTATPAINLADKRELTVTINNYDSTGTIGGVLLSGAVIKPTSDAKVGEVNVTVSAVTGDFTTETFLVGTYTDYGVTVKLDKETVPTLVSGQYSSDSDDVKLQKLVIKEDVANSLLSNRKFKVALPEGVKITAYEVTTSKVTVTPGSDLNYTPDNDNEIEFTVTNPGGKGEIKLQMWISAEASFAGDITATLTGKSLPKDYSIVLGKAVLPATYTVVAKDVKIGLMKQAVGDIVITEPKAGFWAVGDKVRVQFPAEMEVDTDPSIKVTKGDLEIKDENKAASYEFTVKSESSAAPAEVTFTGGTVKVYRDAPEGEYKINVGDAKNLLAVDNAVVKNYDGNAAAAKFDTTGVGKQVAFRVITPAPGDTKVGEKVVFTIDSMEYMVGANKVTSDVAPFINEQNRTMLPLRAFANALNVADTNILWNEAERSVTIFKGDATIKVVIGQMSFIKNGVAVPMDTMAMIKDGRTFLPLRAVAQALGATIVWDEATRTVTIN